MQRVVNKSFAESLEKSLGQPSPRTDNDIKPEKPAAKKESSE